MTTRAMTAAEIADTCLILQYCPHANISGLINGSARVMYDNWAPGSVNVHSFIPEPRFVTKGFLEAIFHYPFGNGGVDWIVGVTPGNNEKALAFNARLGFRPAMCLPGGFKKGVDLIYQIMHYSDCRYYTMETNW